MQELYAITFQLDTVIAELEAGQGTGALRGMKDRILEVINALRSISRELRPPSLAPYGLEKAIRSHVENLRQAHPELHVSLYLDSDGQELPEGARMAMFRIYQTAITNVIRHADAGRAEVRFTLHPQQAMLEIQDNGRGFTLPNRWITLARQGHMGLVGAVERAEAAGGSLQVETQPGQGTLIRVTVPRQPSESNGS
jgi:signal transduction histidine kinase